jgi:uncharacterized protein
MVRPGANARLLAAAAVGDEAAIAGALADGADVDAADAHGRTALLVATQARRTAAAEALLAAGADVDRQDDQRANPLLHAAADGFLPVVRLVNQAGADPRITNRYGGVAIIPASERGHVEVVRYLLSETAVDVNHVNRLGWTALLEAVLLSDGGPTHQEIVRLLLDHGADPNLADGDGVRPLVHARSRGQAEIVAMLEAAGGRE